MVGVLEPGFLIYLSCTSSSRGCRVWVRHQDVFLDHKFRVREVCLEGVSPLVAPRG